MVKVYPDGGGRGFGTTCLKIYLTPYSYGNGYLFGYSQINVNYPAGSGADGGFYDKSSTFIFLYPLNQLTKKG